MVKAQTPKEPTNATLTRSKLRSKLLRQYGCGPVQFTGAYNALYERHLVFDNVMEATAVTTIFPRQGQYAKDSKAIAAYPPADLTVERIGDLLDYDLAALLAGQNSQEVKK